MLFSHSYNRSKGGVLGFRKTSNIVVQSYHSDRQGCFIVAHICIKEEPMTIAALYLEPHLSRAGYADLLCTIMSYVSNGENAWVLFCGDFNAALDPEMDTSTKAKHCTLYGKVLSEFMEVQDLTDVWRVEHPETKRFSCFHESMSRIDLALVSPPLLTHMITSELVCRICLIILLLQLRFH